MDVVEESGDSLENIESEESFSASGDEGDTNVETFDRPASGSSNATKKDENIESEDTTTGFAEEGKTDVEVTKRPVSRSNTAKNEGDDDNIALSANDARKSSLAIKSDQIVDPNIVSESVKIDECAQESRNVSSVGESSATVGEVHTKLFAERGSNKTEDSQTASHELHGNRTETVEIHSPMGVHTVDLHESVSDSGESDVASDIHADASHGNVSKVAESDVTVNLSDTVESEDSTDSDVTDEVSEVDTNVSKTVIKVATVQLNDKPAINNQNVDTTELNDIQNVGDNQKTEMELSDDKQTAEVISNESSNQQGDQVVASKHLSENLIETAELSDKESTDDDVMETSESTDKQMIDSEVMESKELSNKQNTEDQVMETADLSDKENDDDEVIETVQCGEKQILSDQMMETAHSSDKEDADGVVTEMVESRDTAIAHERIVETQSRTVKDGIDEGSEIMEVTDSESEQTNNGNDDVVIIDVDKEYDGRDDTLQAKDPIASESTVETPDKTVDVEGDESILPDAGKTVDDKDIMESEPSEQYVVTNNAEKSECVCMQCSKNNVPKYVCSFEEKTSYICSDDCLNDLKEKKPEKVVVRGLRVKMFASEDLSRHSPIEAPVIAAASPVAQSSFANADDAALLCKECNKPVNKNDYFSWNTDNYCNDACLAIFQKITGVKCVQCKTEVPENLIGKYSVRFGKDMKQFCKNSCLLEHKKGQKFCSVCQAQLSEGEYHGFCSSICFEVHNAMKRKKLGLCSVCLKEKVLEIEYEDENKANMFCGEPCFVAYKFVNNVQSLQCEFCKVYKPKKCMACSFTFSGVLHYLCSRDCQKLFIITNRKIVHCLWCNVKKYNFDMIQIMCNSTHLVLCSLNCYNLYQVSLRRVSSSRGCFLCHKDVKPLFQLTTLDAKVRKFCSAFCLNVYKEGVGSGEDARRATTETLTDAQVNGTAEASTEPQKRPVKKIVVVKPRPIPKQRNMSTMCKPYQITKSINCKPKEVPKSCQTEQFSNKFFLPVPVPIYVPAPLHMYAQPVPMPLPFPIPVPIPIFIPTTRKSASGILKEIGKIKNKVPADPLEAELLMMAEMVAGDKKEESDSESEEDTTAPKEFPSTEPLDTNNSFGEDVLQMALNMASDFEEPVDLEGAVSASTISAQPGNEDSAQRIENIMETKRRSIRQARQGKRKHQPQQEVFHPPPAQPVELEKPDANMCLKYTFGVNAWKQWVTTKNLELQKTSKRVKLFKTEILQLTADELNFSLCLFVKEVRKPNASEYAPDTIYYLCLGIQQYLYENGRIDNIFCDTFYEKFTDCLNEVCRKFSLLYNESQYIVTRVEEEHLWESKQLGAHSPLVLLNTLMFFNTKHFSLTTVDEHLQLSFSHIMKHWKRNPNQPGARNVLLRFYPPQTADGPRKKKVYEQQENEDNPLRCPVKLYEFYLSKCPESVKTRNDVFYLQPERSCVPDSPVWYSTMALGKEPLEKMLNRVKMVKEINVALLTT